jgi:hypothetical protein
MAASPQQPAAIVRGNTIAARDHKERFGGFFVLVDILARVHITASGQSGTRRNTRGLFYDPGPVHPQQPTNSQVQAPTSRLTLISRCCRSSSGSSPPACFCLSVFVAALHCIRSSFVHRHSFTTLVCAFLLSVTPSPSTVVSAASLDRTFFVLDSQAHHTVAQDYIVESDRVAHYRVRFR